jgi:hypothetical protein
MVSFKFSTIATLAFIAHASAAPIPRPFSLGGIVDGLKDKLKTVVGANDIDNEATPTPLKTAANLVISPFVSAAQFARAAYCSPADVTAWTCEACRANAGTKILIAGGDGGITPQYFVGVEPKTNSVIVAHQGTKKENPLSVLNDLEFNLISPPENRFPGAAAKGVKMHNGFFKTFNRTIDQILPVVKQALADNKSKNVLVTGHSLGAAVSLLDALYLRMQLGSDVKITSTQFGLPRAGNPEFADFVEQTLGKDNFKFFINGGDPVPKIPPTNLGFQHPAGELFQKNGTNPQVLDCPGAENENCSAGISLLKADVSAHKGPYTGVFMGGKFCTP